MTQRVTIFWSPHPDDETLRMAGYAAVAAARGDLCILVSVSSGGASGAKPTAWTKQYLMNYRLEEQRKAWLALTNGNGIIMQMGLPDGAVMQAKVTAMAQALQAIYKYAAIEHYCACTKVDAHPDHRAVALGVAALGDTAVVRFGRAPDDVATSGTKYLPPVPADALAADNAYEFFGWISVTTLFQKLRVLKYASRVIV